MVHMRGVGVWKRLEGVWVGGVEGNSEAVALNQQQTFFCGWEWLGVWKAIRWWWSMVNNILSFVVGNDLRVKFCRDVWCGDLPLWDSYPSLFALVSSKDTWVGECWSNPGEGEGWNPLFTRPFNDWGWRMQSDSFGYWKVCA